MTYLRMSTHQLGLSHSISGSVLLRPANRAENQQSQEATKKNFNSANLILMSIVKSGIIKFEFKTLLCSPYCIYVPTLRKQTGLSRISKNSKIVLNLQCSPKKLSPKGRKKLNIPSPPWLLFVCFNLLLVKCPIGQSIDIKPLSFCSAELRKGHLKGFLQSCLYRNKYPLVEAKSLK